MTEPEAIGTTVKSFLIGVSVGTLLATFLKPRDLNRVNESLEILKTPRKNHFPRVSHGSIKFSGMRKFAKHGVLVPNPLLCGTK